MIVSSLIGLAMASALLLHPVHETVIELEWNDQTKRTEVAVRLDMLDEQWIEKRHADVDDKTWRTKLLEKRIWFDPQPIKGKRDQFQGRPIRWVGRKEDGGHVWWFFEVESPNKKPPSELRTDLLLRQNRDFKHLVVILGRKTNQNGTQKQPAMVLNEKTPQAKLDW